MKVRVCLKDMNTSETVCSREEADQIFSVLQYALFGLLWSWLVEKISFKSLCFSQLAPFSKNKSTFFFFSFIEL